MKDSDDDEIQKMLDENLNPESRFEHDPEDLKIRIVSEKALLKVFISKLPYVRK